MIDFLWMPIGVGVGVALVAGPIGCFVVWRRMAYFGDSLSHAGLLGIAVGAFFDIDFTLAAIATSLLLAYLLYLLQRRGTLAPDTLLGVLAHGGLAIGLIVVSQMPSLRVDLQAYLFGDILAVNATDIGRVWLGGIVVLAILVKIWRPFLSATVDRELARAEGVPVALLEVIFTLLLALLIVLAMKLVGVLLITALLIIPAASARRFSRTPEQMALLASILGGMAVIAGSISSYQWDLPSGPAIVVAAVLLFVVSLVSEPLKKWREKS